MKTLLHRIRHRLLLLAVAASLCGGLSFGVQGAAAADVMLRLSVSNAQSAPFRTTSFSAERPVSPPVFNDRASGKTLKIVSTRARKTSQEKDSISVFDVQSGAGIVLACGFGILLFLLRLLFSQSLGRTTIIEYIHNQDGLK